MPPEIPPGFFSVILPSYFSTDSSGDVCKNSPRNFFNNSCYTSFKNSTRKSSRDLFNNFSSETSRIQDLSFCFLQFHWDFRNSKRLLKESFSWNYYSDFKKKFHLQFLQGILPTKTFSVILLVISLGIPSQIPPENTSAIDPNILPGIASGISTRFPLKILSEIPIKYRQKFTPGIPPRISPTIYQGIPPRILPRIPPRILPLGLQGFHKKYCY